MSNKHLKPALIAAVLLAQIAQSTVAFAETGAKPMLRSEAYRAQHVVPRDATTEDLNPGQSIDMRLAEEMANHPKDIEVRLSVHDRILFAKILFKVFCKGFIFEVDALEHKLTKTSAGRGNEVKDLSQKITTKFEMDILTFIRDLVDKDLLNAYLNEKIIWISNLPIVGKKLHMTDAKRALMVTFAANQLQDAVRTRGMTQDTSTVHYKEWFDVSSLWNTRVENHTVLPVVQWAPSVSFDQAEPLINGEASFAKRTELFANVQNTLDIMVWAIYDDVTGQWLYDQLKQIRTTKPNVKIRIVVDGQTADLPGYHSMEDKISTDFNIPLIKWINPVARFEGMHRKMLVVDGQHVVAGGMNFGDEYSHLNPDPKSSKWRDTDIYLHGDVANVSQRFFDEFWNNAVKAMQLDPSWIGPVAADTTTPLVADAKEKSVALLNQDPTIFNEGSPIWIAMMNDIQKATTRIDIENAYIITIPAFSKALHQAVDRGVKCRVFTNSIQSVDEPSIGAAMQRTAQDLFNAGCEVYMRKGSTVHSKFMIFDDSTSYVMSYNLHPRSEHIEGEMAYRFTDTDVATKLDAAFVNDITDPATSFQVTDPKILNIDDTIELWVLIRLMYDQI